MQTLYSAELLNIFVSNHAHGLLILVLLLGTSAIILILINLNFKFCQLSFNTLLLNNLILHILLTYCRFSCLLETHYLLYSKTTEKLFGLNDGISLANLHSDVLTDDMQMC